MLAPGRAAARRRASDDGAGDALTPQAEAEMYLPVPAIFEDERVVAAAGPLARLECHKDDPPSLTRDADARRTGPARWPSPLAGAGSDAGFDCR